MAMKAKIAFGALERIDEALSAQKIDAFDVLLVKDASGKPYVGWIDKDGQTVIVNDDAEFAALESAIATKADAEEVEAKIATKAEASEVNAKIDTMAVDMVASANSYTDKKVEETVNELVAKKYEITSVPEGTLIDYRDKEIRVMVPAGTKWVKQNVGSTGNADMYYMGFKAYAPKDAVSFKEGDRGVIIDEMFDFTGSFAGTDESGRNYSICWLALASYDATSGTWSYFGKNSSTEKYIGWTYVVEWYNANGTVIETDSVRINLSNEACHSVVEPYYVGSMMKEIDTKIEEKIADASFSCEIIEF